MTCLGFPTDLVLIINNKYDIRRTRSIWSCLCHVVSCVNLFRGYSSTSSTTPRNSLGSAVELTEELYPSLFRGPYFARKHCSDDPHHQHTGQS